MLTPEQRERRRERVGASDVPAILGLSRFGDSYTVYCDKKGIDTGKPDRAARIRMAAGNALESVCLDFFEEEYLPEGCTLERDVEVLPPGDIQGANLDAFFTFKDKPYVVEAKTSNDRGYWKDGVPAAEQSQCQAQMYCTDSHKAYVVLYQLWDGDIVVYEVDRDDAWIEEIRTEVDKLWYSHVLANVPPKPTRKAMAVESRRPRVRGLSKPIPRRLHNRLETARANTKRAEEVQHAIETELKAELGEAEIGICEAVGKEWAYEEQSREVLTKKAKPGEEPCPHCGIVRRVVTFRKLLPRTLRTALPKPAVEIRPPKMEG